MTLDAIRRFVTPGAEQLAAASVENLQFARYLAG